MAKTLKQIIGGVLVGGLIAFSPGCEDPSPPQPYVPAPKTVPWIELISPEDHSTVRNTIDFVWEIKNFKQGDVIDQYVNLDKGSGPCDGWIEESMYAGTYTATYGDGIAKWSEFSEDYYTPTDTTIRKRITLPKGRYNSGQRVAWTVKFENISDTNQPGFKCAERSRTFYIE
jgi:hypothetical protein